MTKRVIVVGQKSKVTCKEISFVLNWVNCSVDPKMAACLSVHSLTSYGPNKCLAKSDCIFNDIVF